LVLNILLSKPLIWVWPKNCIYALRGKKQPVSLGKNSVKESSQP